MSNTIAPKLLISYLERRTLTIPCSNNHSKMLTSTSTAMLTLLNSWTTSKQTHSRMLSTKLTLFKVCVHGWPYHNLSSQASLIKFHSTRCRRLNTSLKRLNLYSHGLIIISIVRGQPRSRNWRHHLVLCPTKTSTRLRKSSRAVSMEGLLCLITSCDLKIMQFCENRNSGPQSTLWDARGLLKEMMIFFLSLTKL